MWASLVARLSGFMGSRLSGYLLIAALTAFGGLYVLWRIEANQHTDTIEELATYKANQARYEASIKSANETINTLMDVAEQNRQAAIRAVMRAEIAQESAEIIRNQSEKDIEAIRNEADQFRNTPSDCRRLDEPLPDDFVKWVWGNESSD